MNLPPTPGPKTCARRFGTLYARIAPRSSLSCPTSTSIARFRSQRRQSCRVGPLPPSPDQHTPQVGAGTCPRRFATLPAPSGPRRSPLCPASPAMPRVASSASVSEIDSSVVCQPTTATAPRRRHSNRLRPMTRSPGAAPRPQERRISTLPGHRAHRWRVSRPRFTISPCINCHSALTTRPTAQHTFCSDDTNYGPAHVSRHSSRPREPPIPQTTATLGPRRQPSAGSCRSSGRRSSRRRS